MNILIIGSGAREHALAWSLGRSRSAHAVYVSPGHAGLAPEAEAVNLPTPDAIRRFAREHDCLVVIGPEQPLADGLSDWLRGDNIRVVGPSRRAARVESSKADAKRLMAKAGIPTARFVVVDREADALTALAHDFPEGCAVKADGLAQGKGVFVCDSPHEALQAVHRLLTERRLGAAGARVVLEERLRGEEMSAMVVTDGTRFQFLPSARDYKRLLDDDRGPNTGGMGAVAPHPSWTPRLADTLAATVIDPLLHALREEGRPFVGILYAGLMLTDNGPYVLEWNARLGDPEAGVVLPLVTDDLLEVFSELADGKAPVSPLHWEGAAVGVVMAAPGYPEAPRRDIPLSFSEVPGALLFQAGTRRVGGQLVNGGGRTFLAVGRGATWAEARALAYRQVAGIQFPGAQFRRDIAANLSAAP
jgi:phosphoribosylamine--glycine ligase